MKTDTEQFDAERKNIETLLNSPDEAKGWARIKGASNKLNSFAYWTQPATIESLKAELGLPDTSSIESFQAFLRGESADMTQVKAFADAWSNAKKNGSICPHSWEKEIDTFVQNLLSVDERVAFFYSDCDPRDLEADYDISKQKGRMILNPASRKGWGAGGASAAIQKALGKDFKAAQERVMAPHVNAVGNAEVGRAFFVRATVGMVRNNDSAPAVVGSVAGPNLNAHTGLGFKVKSRALFKGKHASQRQERKLRASYRAFFEGALRYNEQADEKVHGLSLVPISANIFGYPPEEAGKVMVEETLRFMAQHPEYDVRFLAADSAPVKKGIEDSASHFRIKTQESKGIQRDAA